VAASRRFFARKNIGSNNSCRWARTTILCVLELVVLPRPQKILASPRGFVVTGTTRNFIGNGHIVDRSKKGMLHLETPKRQLLYGHEGIGKHGHCRRIAPFDRLLSRIRFVSSRTPIPIAWFLTPEDRTMENGRIGFGSKFLIGDLNPLDLGQQNVINFEICRSNDVL